MNELNLLLTFAGGLGAALVLGYAAQRLRLSPIVGYLLAGVVVGPFTPGYVAHQQVAEQFAEIGVILLLFGIGLRFQLVELFAVWRVAVPGALIQSAVSTTMLATLLVWLGWSWTSGLVLGLAISVSSTVVMATVLAERRDLHSPVGHLAIGWTVVEDLITVGVLLLLPLAVGGGDGAGHDALAALGLTALQIVGLVTVVIVLGRWVIPWTLERIERTRSRELFTLAVLVLALGIAVGAALVFNVSMALGAFLAGLAVGRSDFAARAASDAVPMRDAFAVLFFVSVGMLFDPMGLARSPLLVLAVLAVVLAGKPLAALLTVRLLGRPWTTAFAVGAAISQVGEFSFILGRLGRDLGLLDDAGWNALIGASILSIALNPSVYRWTRRRTGARPRLEPAATRERSPVQPQRTILIGYGPVGRTVHQLLTQQGAEITVIELNLQTVRELATAGIAALHGDVLRSEILERAGVATAGSLILSADVEDAAEIVRQAKVANPALRVFARCAHLRDAAALQRAGADVVAAGEAEVAVALAEAVAVETAAAGAPCIAVEERVALRRRLYAPADPG